MNSNHNTSDLDLRLSEALELKPSVRVPADFAGGVAARASSQPALASRRVRSYGRAATFASAALLLLTMFALAPRTQPAFTSIAFDLEMLAAAQLIGIACWLTARRSA